MITFVKVFTIIDRDIIGELFKEKLSYCSSSKSNSACKVSNTQSFLHIKMSRKILQTASTMTLFLQVTILEVVCFLLAEEDDIVVELFFLLLSSSFYLHPSQGLIIGWLTISIFLYLPHLVS